MENILHLEKYFANDISFLFLSNEEEIIVYRDK